MRGLFIIFKALMKNKRGYMKKLFIIWNFKRPTPRMGLCMNLKSDEKKTCVN